MVFAFSSRQKSLRQQSVLARFGEHALKSDSLDEILTEACRLVGEAIGTELAKVMELQEDGETLLVRAGVGWNPGVVGRTTVSASDDTSESYALRTGGPMISPDLTKETRFTYPPFLAEHGVRAVVSVIIIGGKNLPPFGILQVDSRKPRRFSDNDTSFLRGYANLIAAAVDRLRVVAEVRNGEARLLLALNAGKLGSWDLNLNKGTMTRTPRYDEIFGYPDLQRSWDYQTFLKHVLPTDRQLVEDTFHRAVDEGNEWHFKCRVRRAGDDAIRWIEGRSKLWGVQGKHPTDFSGIIADITEQKQAEEELLRANELLEGRVVERTLELTIANGHLQEQAAELADARATADTASEAKSQFLAAMSHELRTPLTSLIGFSELMLRDDLDPVTRRRYLEIQCDTAQTLHALVSGILDLSKIEAAKLELEDVPFQLRSVINGCKSLVEPLVRNKGLLLTTTIGETVPDWLLGDPGRLRQVILNFLGNAVKFTNKGSVALTTDAIHRLDGKRYLRVAVSDTGIGIPADKLSRLFNPFTQADSSISREYGGTGLGLAICKRVIEFMGGDVGVRSQGVTGSTFWFEIPLMITEAPREDGARFAAIQRTLNPKRILIAEDNSTIQLLLSAVLTSAEHQVEVVGDGKAAVEAALHGNFDVMLMDTQMPIMGGLEATRRIRAAEAGYLAIIALTANVTTADMQLCFDAGMNGFLPKPIDIPLLLEAIESANATDRSK